MAITIPTDQASVDHGKHIYERYGLCAECHADNVGGENIGEDPVFERLVASNLTTGKGGVGSKFQDIDYVRAIRHGLGQDRKPLVIMPVQYFTKFSDRDLGALIAYIKSVLPVDNELPKTKLGPLGRVITLVDPHEFLPPPASSMRPDGTNRLRPSPKSMASTWARSASRATRRTSPVDLSQVRNRVTRMPRISQRLRSRSGRAKILRASCGLP